MNSALKPIPSSGPQNTSVNAQMNKSPMMQPGSGGVGVAGVGGGGGGGPPPPATYGQPSHIPPNLVNLQQHNNTNVAHAHAHSINNSTTPNHYLNVPSTPHNFATNTPPSSNHPVAAATTNVTSQQQQTPQVYNSPAKIQLYSSGYQPNLGHPPNQTNTLPPVSQTLPASSALQAVQPPQPVEAAQPAAVERPQSNGVTVAAAAATAASPSAEAKTPVKADQPAMTGNHISPQKDKTPVVVPSPQNLPEKAVAVAKVADQKDVNNVPSAEIEAAAVPPADKPETKEKQPSTETESIPTEQEAKTAESSSEVPAEPAASSTSTANNNNNASTSSSTPQKSSRESSPQKSQSPGGASAVKLATITTPRAMRKSKTPKSETEASPQGKSKSATPVQKSPTTGKVKRQRVRTQPYQSPLPELENISKISMSTPRTRNSDDKLIVFYKNEFLAVRNSECGFYVCQAVQNVYKTSSKIKIRWLSQDKNDKTGEIYTPDFYDLTDFDCILTNLNLNRVDKGKFRLPPAEKERTDSILNRSLAVEKGEVTSPSLTEEHPDGLDLSLYTEESQLNKRKGVKRKGRSMKSSRSTSPSKKSPNLTKVRKVAGGGISRAAAQKKAAALKKTAATRVLAKPAADTRKSAASTSNTSAAVSRAGRAKRRSDNSGSPVVDQKKAKVLAKVVKKTITVSKSAVTTTPKSSKGTKAKGLAAKAGGVAQKPAATTTRKTKRATRK